MRSSGSKSSQKLGHSQNFLTSSDLINSLLETTTIGGTDVVLDIGAGHGAITTELAKRARQVVAIEADPQLASGLVQTFKATSNVRVIKADFLKLPLLRAPYKVFANIPFNLTSAIVRKLVESENAPKDCYLFVQKEAAKKLAGKPVASKESQFSVLLKPWFKFTLSHQFKRTDFKPAPAVDVVLLRIESYTQPLIELSAKKLYRDFVVFAFNQTQPNLMKGLENIFSHSQFERLAKDLRFSLRAKPTELGLEQWLGLFRSFMEGTDKRKRQVVVGSENKLKKQQAGVEKIHRTRLAKNWRQVKPRR